MITIVDYGLGNLGSVANMLKKIGEQSIISSDPEVISQAKKLILPGVGAFDQGMTNLNERGFLPILNRKVIEEGVPILGLCLGMQLFTQSSEEGKLPGLGWLDAVTKRFHFDDASLRIPTHGLEYNQDLAPGPNIYRSRSGISLLLRPFISFILPEPR